VEVGLDLAQLPDLAAANDVQQASSLRLERKDKCLPQQSRTAPRLLQYLLGLRQRHAERLLAEHRFPGLHSRNGPLGMQRVGQSNVNGLDLIVGQQLRIPLNGVLHAILFRKTTSAVPVTPGNGVRGAACRAQGRQKCRPCNVRGADDAPAGGIRLCH